MLLRQLAVMAMIATLVCTSRSLAAEITKETLAEVKKAIDKDDAVLVDVREKSEWEKGHVKGAILLSLSELQGKVDVERLKARLPKDKVLYTHCVVGKRAVTAGTLLEKYGYEVRCLKPGYKELLGAGFEKAKD